jgi:hypothetical protein
VELVRELVARHAQYTGSELASRLLCDWSSAAGLFVKVMPRDYKRALETPLMWSPASARPAEAIDAAPAAVPVNVISGVLVPPNARRGEGGSRTVTTIEVAHG